MFVRDEIASQPECWRKIATLAQDVAGLPEKGERVAVVGCGTSWFIAQSYAALREARGQGITDAFAASEMPKGRAYDRVVAITRSGTTTEVLHLLDSLDPARSTVLTGVPEAIGDRAREVIDLRFADERSVVQTRFATSALALLRTHLGVDVLPAADQAQRVLDTETRELVDAEQFTFVGTGQNVGIANEAALKMREASRSWAESYPAHEYRHGPISIAAPGRVVWMFGEVPDGLTEDVRATGARIVHEDIDPLASLVRAQLLAVAIAEHHGLDPDQPRHLSRSVVLE
ncbi:SIS domain-containing protein [Sciscionella sediminilitoris]|uniref:SIS domain-containing protein n=1 Tax=Sciscionella sediminilitoris TaxID=1445613 RepID=UPI0004DF4E38|nr:SIS domain-containing protein [Sciscionella sp. SE31]